MSLIQGRIYNFLEGGVFSKKLSIKYFPSSPNALKRPCFGQTFCAAGKLKKKQAKQSSISLSISILKGPSRKILVSVIKNGYLKIVQREDTFGRQCVDTLRKRASAPCPPPPPPPNFAPALIEDKIKMRMKMKLIENPKKGCTTAQKFIFEFASNVYIHLGQPSLDENKIAPKLNSAIQV